MHAHPIELLSLVPLTTIWSSRTAIAASRGALAASLLGVDDAALELSTVEPQAVSLQFVTDFNEPVIICVREANTHVTHQACR